MNMAAQAEKVSDFSVAWEIMKDAHGPLMFVFLIRP